MTDSIKPRGTKLFFLVLFAIAAIVLIALSGSIVESVDADEIVVIQDPVDGELHFYFSPGLKYQNFGTAQHYKKESQYWFSSAVDQGSAADQSIKIRFNDGGHAKISGSIRFKLPMDETNMSKIHMLYGSQEAVEQQLIRTVIEKSVYMTGPLMSSKESYAERRNDLLSFIDDQAAYGVYKTTTKEVKGIDPLSGKEKTVTVVEIVKDTTANTLKRQGESPLADIGIGIYNLSINKIVYDEVVDQQIKAQQKAIMDVQTAIAETKKAEQNAIKVEEEGKASAAKAKWDQEVIKAKMVTEAEQTKEVARLGAEEAEYYKKEQTLRGEGEATYKRLVMQADGALKQKLETYENVQKYWADAVKGYTGNWVPNIVMGESQGNSNGANKLVDFMTVKYANDLSLDLGIKK